MWKPTNPPNASTPNAKETNPNQTVTNAMQTNSPALTEPTPVSAPRTTVQSPQEQATIGKSLFIKGEVSGSESLYIDGRVEGTINLAGNRVTVGRNGQVTANVTAREIVVLGKLKGNLTASDRVDIRNEGSLTGDVTCQRISIEDGAYFKGGIDIRRAGQNEEPASKKPTMVKETPAVVTA